MNEPIRILRVLSVVIPGLNEAENLPFLHHELVRTLGGKSWQLEILFIDDGSTDKTLEICQKLHREDPQFHYLSLSRNFGHQRALTAGLDHVAGDAVVVMDADLQDPPEVVYRMIELWERGVDVAYGRRNTRQGETWFKIFTAKMFYRLMNQLCGIKIPEDVGDFRLMDMRVVKELRRLREEGRFMRGLVTWVGFRQEAVLYDRLPRLKGASKYPFLRMLRFATDGISSFSALPLRFAMLAGVLVSLASFALAAVYIVRKLLYNDYIHGWASIMVAIFGIGGLQLFCIGIVGEYLARVYENGKGRPLYLVREIGTTSLRSQGGRDGAAHAFANAVTERLATADVGVFRQPAD